MKPQASKPLSYLGDHAKRLQFVRAVAMVATLFGALRVLLSPLIVGHIYAMYAQNPTPLTELPIVRKIAEGAMLFLLAVLLLVAGGECLRSQRTGVLLLIAWAYLALAYSGYCIVFDVALFGVYEARAISISGLLWAIARALERWAWDLHFPVLLIALLTPVRRRLRGLVK
jgi:hypothetical protein